MERLKREYLKISEEFKEKPQEGIKFHLEFYYLLNTDLTYIFNKVREAIFESILDKCYEIENKDLRRKLHYEIEHKPIIITLNVEQISTEKSIDIIVSLGIIDPLVEVIILNIAGGIATYLIIESFKKLRHKKAVPNGRNLKRKKMSRVTYKTKRDGTIEVIEEKEILEFD